MANSPLKIFGIVASATIGVASAAYGAQTMIIKSLTSNEVDFEFRASEQIEVITRDGSKIVVYRDVPDIKSTQSEEIKKPTILFMHGYALCSPIWSFQFDLLRDKYDLVSIDLRGHGASTVGDNGINLKSFADDVYDIIESLKLDDIVIVGHSTGGVIALSYMKEHNEHSEKHIKGLCLVSTLVQPPYNNQKNLSDALSGFSLAGKALHTLSSIQAFGYPMARFAMGKKASSSSIEFVRRSISSIDSEVSNEILRMLLHFSFTEELENFKGKSCVIVGGSDPITPNSDAIFVAELLGGEVDIIDGVSHVPMLESPDEFNEILENFLDNIGE